jgi:hypothetical protein
MSVDIEARDDRLDSTFMAEAIEYLAHALTREGIAIKQQTEADSIQPAIPPARSVVGKWRGSSDGDVLELILEADGKVDMTIKGQSFKKEVIQNRRDIIYTADLSTSPMRLDFTSMNAAGEEIGQMKMIFKFSNKNTIKLRTYFNNDRPDGFLTDSDANTIILQKVD